MTRVKETHCDVLIVGGGVGGCAAALGAASTHKHVILTKKTDWIGGQFTSQAVPADEHRWIEQFGCTRRYRVFREGIREYYRRHYPLTPQARGDALLNPGLGRVSRISCEPRIALAVLEQMLTHPRAAGFLEIRYHQKPVVVETEDDSVQAVQMQNLYTGDIEIISADFVLDATELGDLLPLAGVEYVTGAEAQSETGEPHAPSEAQPDNVQAFTWCFPMTYDPQGEHLIERPEQYDRWREYIPNLDPPWPGPLLDWRVSHSRKLTPWKYVLLPEEEVKRGQSLWLYRQIICRDHYPAGAMPHAVTLVNWAQNDYFEGNIIDKPPETVKLCLEEARQLSLSLFYWLQTDAPRPDGGMGYQGLYLRPDLVGTSDGLAKSPYIRESRRVRAVFTVTENHVSAELPNSNVAERFSDSVGVGCYRIDLHMSTGGDNYIDIGALPFQIPLGSLIPIRVENLLPACKNLGVTHITNGCFRLHPVEWNIGESAGLLAAFCLEGKLRPRQVRDDKNKLCEFQDLLESQGIELDWPKLRAM